MKNDNNSKKLFWTIIFNILITVTEIVGGVLSGSLALISDAGHNFADVISLVIGYFGERLSAVGPSKNHSFGLKRMEIFTALINALSLWIIGILIIVEALKRVGSNETLSIGLMLSVAAIGLLGNLFSILVLNKNKDHNLNMNATYLHLFYDTISSMAVITSSIIIFFTGFISLDILVGIFIALMIFWSGFKIIKKSIHIFLQGVPEGIDFDEVYEKINKIKGVKSVHGLHIWSISSQEIFLSCHLCVKESIKNSDDIINTVTKMLEKEFGIDHTAIQIEKKRVCKTKNK